MIDFNLIRTRVRPVRAVVLIDGSDPHWKQLALGSIEFLTTVWGGAHDLIVPVGEGGIEPLFRSIISIFDPDIVLQYQKTWEDVRRISPEEFMRAVAARAESDVKTLGEQHRAERLAAASDDLLKETASIFFISQTDQDWLRTLAPLQTPQQVVHGFVNSSSTPKYPLTSIFDVLRTIDPPTSVVRINATEDIFPELWIASQTGRYKDAHLLSLRTVQNDLEVTLQDVLESLSGRRSDIQGRLPFDVSMINLSHVHITDYDARGTAIIGSSARDFGLYYALSRLTDNVVWIPAEWISPKDQRIASQALQVVSLYGAFDVAVTSTSIALEELNELSKSLAGTELSVLVEAPEAVVGNVGSAPRRAYDLLTDGNVSTGQFVDGELAGTIDTPKPSGFTRVNPFLIRWIAEVSIDGYHWPRQENVATEILRAPKFDQQNSRSGADALAYVCPTRLSVASHAGTHVSRPKIQLVDAFHTFQILASAEGNWVRRSDKGVYTTEVVAKIGTLEQAATFFRDQRYRSLLDVYKAQRAGGKLDSSPGYFLGDKRRYLRFSDIQHILGSSEEAMRLIDLLIYKKLLYRGFLFRCSYCRLMAWYDVTEITTLFRCKRCRREQMYGQLNWKESNEPAWYYQLDELFYQGYNSDMHVSVLALARSGRFERDFMYCHDLDLIQQDKTKPWMETDFSCILGGRVVLGEAKTEDRLDDTAAKERAMLDSYGVAAKMLRAEKLVFATFSEEWSTGTLSRIDALSSKIGMPVIKMNRELLLG
jgi:hypothetical protein